MPGDRITLGVSLPAGDSVTLSGAEQPATIYVIRGRRTPKLVRGSRFSPQTKRQLCKGNFREKKTTTNRALFPSPLPIEQHALHFMNFTKPHRTQNRTGGRAGIGTELSCISPSIIQGPDWSRTPLSLESLNYCSSKVVGCKGK